MLIAPRAFSLPCCCRHLLSSEPHVASCYCSAAEYPRESQHTVLIIPTLVRGLRSTSESIQQCKINFLQEKVILYWRAQAKRDIFIERNFHVALYYSDSLHLYYSIVQRKVCIGWIFYAVFVLLYLSVETCSDTEPQGESPRCSPPGWKHKSFH